MEKKLSFTEDNKEAIIAEQAKLGFRLKEVQLYSDGHWLIFTDEPYKEEPPIRDLAKEIDELKAKVALLESKSIIG